MGFALTGETPDDRLTNPTTTLHQDARQTLHS